MTTPNEELIAALTQTNQFHESADICTVDVIAVLQSQAERIKELEGDVEYLQEDIDAMCNAIPSYNWGGGAAELIAKCFAERDTLRAQIADAELHTKQVERGLDKATAQLAAIAATEPVFYEYQWTNPGNQPYQPESMFVWARVDPAWNGTVQQKVDELLAYRYDDKPTYRVRALFTRPMPAQDVNASMVNLPEPVAWFANYGGNVYTEAQLKQAVRDALDTQGVAELVDALEMIVSTHQGHCEHHVGVSKHSYNLADIAEEALSKYKGVK